MILGYNFSHANSHSDKSFSPGKEKDVKRCHEYYNNSRSVQGRDHLKCLRSIPQDLSQLGYVNEQSCSCMQNLQFHCLLFLWGEEGEDRDKVGEVSLFRLLKFSVCGYESMCEQKFFLMGISFSPYNLSARIQPCDLQENLS